MALSRPAVFLLPVTINMKNPQSDRRSTKQVRIDAGLHQLLKVKAAESGTSIKELVEGCLAELLAVQLPANTI